MESGSATLRLAAVMSAVAIGFLVGRWVMEAAREFAGSGAFPGL